MPLGWKKSRQGRGMTWYVLKSCLAVPSLRKAELFSLIFHLVELTALCSMGMQVMPILLNITKTSEQGRLAQSWEKGVIFILKRNMALQLTQKHKTITKIQETKFLVLHLPTDYTAFKNAHLLKTRRVFYPLILNNHCVLSSFKI